MLYSPLHFVPLTLPNSPKVIAPKTYSTLIFLNVLAIFVTRLHRQMSYPYAVTEKLIEKTCAYL